MEYKQQIIDIYIYNLDKEASGLNKVNNGMDMYGCGKLALCILNFYLDFICIWILIKSHIIPR